MAREVIQTHHMFHGDREIKYISLAGDIEVGSAPELALDDQLSLWDVDDDKRQRCLHAL